MDAHELQDILEVALDEISSNSEDMGIEGLDNTEIMSFERAGLLSTDAGLVLKTEDGSEFQITIVQTR